MNKKWIQQTLQIYFLISNGIAFLIEIIDIAYFPYVHKRMTIDVFKLIGKKSDFLDLLPNYILKFWNVPILFLLFILLLIFINKKIKIVDQENTLFKDVVTYVLLITVSVVAIRGGLQLRPISINSAIIHSIPSQNIPLILNTTFSIFKSTETGQLEEYHFMENSELTQYFNPIKQYHTSNTFKMKNVVIIILESFGKGLTGLGGRQSYTPFLDSLMQHSYVFSNAFANAFRSADGIPAILSSIPYMMNDAFPFSIYSTNKIESLPSILKQQGYTTSFFHGGTNGTMNLDTYSQSAGIDHYFGRREYDNDKDYDGTWGIWDENFLQYFESEISKQKEPFISTVFTLSSHEPFHLPPQYENTEMAKLNGIERGITYSDMALRKFFEQASRQKWFANTLFVITADHNYLAYEDPQHYYNQSLGIFAIPIVFFSPNEKRLIGNDTTLMQQIDIMPSVLQYLNYNKPFFSFGNSVWDNSQIRFLICGISSTAYYYSPPMLLTANDGNINGYYNFKTDSNLSENLIQQKDSQFINIETRYKAYIQLLNDCLIHNKQSVQTFIHSNNTTQNRH